MPYNYGISEFSCLRNFQLFWHHDVVHKCCAIEVSSCLMEAIEANFKEELEIKMQEDIVCLSLVVIFNTTTKHLHEYNNRKQLLCFLFVWMLIYFSILVNWDLLGMHGSLFCS